MARADEFKIGLIQMSCSPALGTKLEDFEQAIKDVAKKGAQVICLPELFHAQYFCSKEDAELFNLAQPIPSELTDRFQMLARALEVVLILPVFERRAAGVYHNSAVVVDADGKLLGTYRKMHIPDDPLYYEKYYFTPGDAEGEGQGFRIFKTRYADVGVLICWDQWYPEAARLTTLAGAEVLFYPTAIGWHPKEKAEFGETQADAWRTVQRGHAIANGVYVAAVNRVGHEKTEGTDGIEFFGRSFVSSPFGRILAEAGTGTTENIVVTCSRKELEGTRRNWPFLRDRRVDAFSPITKRFLY